MCQALFKALAVPYQYSHGMIIPLIFHSWALPCDSKCLLVNNIPIPPMWTLPYDLHVSGWETHPSPEAALSHCASASALCSFSLPQEQNVPMKGCSFSLGHRMERHKGAHLYSVQSHGTCERNKCSCRLRFLVPFVSVLKANITFTNLDRGIIIISPFF